MVSREDRYFRTNMRGVNLSLSRLFLSQDSLVSTDSRFLFFQKTGDAQLMSCKSSAKHLFLKIMVARKRSGDRRLYDQLDSSHRDQ